MRSDALRHDTVRNVPAAPVEIIDCHVHPSLSPEMWFGWFQPLESPAEFVAALRRNGIARACGACIVRDAGDDFAATAECNGAVMRFAEACDGFFLPAVQVHPRFPEESCREMQRLHAQGVRWVGEMVGYLMGYGEEYTTAGAFQIYDLARQLGMVVHIHSRHAGAVSKVCTTFPELPIVLAHLDVELQSISDRVAMVKAHGNLHLDISGLGVGRYGVVRYAVDRIGAHRVLFGSDYPICAPASIVPAVLDEPLTDPEREAIFSGNFKRLASIPEGPISESL